MNEDWAGKGYRLRELYEEYMPAVYRAAFHHTKSHSKAETLVRDSFLDLAGSKLLFQNKRQIRDFLIVAAIKRSEEENDCNPQESKIQQSDVRRSFLEQEGYTAAKMDVSIRIWQWKCLGK